MVKDMFGLILLFIFLIICSYTDIKERSINVGMIILFAILGILCSNAKIISIFIGIIPGILLFLVNRLTNGQIGIGDVLVLIVVGIILGFEKTVIILMLSTLMAGIYGIIKMLIFKVNRKETMAFAPFVLLAYIVVAVRYING